MVKRTTKRGLTSLLPAQIILKMDSIDEISARLCLKDDFYLFADFEKIFNIGVNNIKILKSKIMKTFLIEKLLYDLRALFSDGEVMELPPDFFIKIFNIQEAENDKDWGFYEQGILDARGDGNHEWYKTFLFPIIDNLAIHITDLSTVLRNCGLFAEAEFFSLIELKKRTKQGINKLETAKRNKKIIEQYTIILKDKPSLNIANITKLIKDTLSLNLSERTIADIITEHHKQYVKYRWENHLKQKEEQIEEIMLGIDWADTNKNENGLLPKISMEQPILHFNSGADMYFLNQDFIQNLWAKCQGRPTEKQVTEGLDNKVKEKIMSKLCIKSYKLDQMTKNLPILPRPTPPPPAYLWFI